MKLKLAFCVMAAAATAALLPRSPIATAQATDAFANDTKASADIAARIRPLGLNVVGQPAKQGSVYVVNALDPRGAELRVIVDARQGHVVSIGPAPAPAYYASSPSAYSPHYDASPRIINIAPVTADNEDDYATPAPRPVERRVEPRRPRIESRRSEPQRAEPRAAVRQITPSLERPRDPLPQVGDSDKVEIDALRDEIRREFERRQRASAPPPPRERPRTVLAPPPYADQALTPVRPLHRRDTGKFALPADPAAIEEPAAPPTAAEEARSEAHAAVPQILPQIPPPPRAVGLPVPPADAAQKPESAAPAAAENPEDSPPGTAVGDFGPKAKR